MKAKDVTRLLRYHALTTRLMADTRFDRQSPSLHGDVFRLALLIAWQRYCAPPTDDFWAEVGRLYPAGNRAFYIRSAIAADAPRYRPAEAGWHPPCEAPMIRREGPCGRPSTNTVVIWNPADGTGREAAYCSEKRHVAVWRAVREEQWALERSGTLPEPVPNQGGLLPCYFPTRAFKWDQVYAWATHGAFKAPAAGLCADDWPAAEPVPVLKLTMIAGGGSQPAVMHDQEGDAMPARLRAVPPLADGG